MSYPTTTPNKVTIDPFFGVVAKQDGWVPSLRYLLRRERINQIMNQLSKGKLLEIGCATGALLIELSQKGFICTGVETSKRALNKAKIISGSLNADVNLLSKLEYAPQNEFDIVCAFDVLEHIERDFEAIESWKSKLKPGGSLILSVPAHKKRWGAGDIWAGHYRRYERSDLIDLLAANNLILEHMECYGFPIANITELLGNIIYKKNIDKINNNKKLASANSGIDRGFYIRYFNLLDNPISRLLLRLAYLTQNIMLNTNLGSGYIVVAKKK